jgi:DNA topoisomerase-1
LFVSLVNEIEYKDIHFSNKKIKFEKILLMSKPTIVVESPKTLKKRWDKKKLNIGALAHNIRSLRYNVTLDLKSDDEKKFMTALAVDLMDKTAERVGNDESASNGHFGITGLNKHHISVDGNAVTLKYKGKSGVQHDKTITDAGLADSVRKAIKISPTRYLLCTSDKFKINADRINRYLADYEITAKDIRGYSANKWIINKLKEVEPAEDEAKRKKQFNEIAKKVAKKVGHGLPTLKKHYMIPELETSFISRGKVIDMKRMGYYKNGGTVSKKKYHRFQQTI